MKRPELNELTLTEKIAQLLMPNEYTVLQKCEISEETPRPKAEIAEFMSKYQYGSFWGSGNMLNRNANLAESNVGLNANASEYKAWLEELQSNVRIPMLVGVDCENGTNNMVTDGTRTSVAISIGAADDEELTFELAAAVAREIKALGANWRWTPILDLHNRFGGGGIRVYSDNLDRISKLARATIRGTQSENVASTIKHFPGHDIYEFRDAHFVETIITMPFDDWWNTQAKVFQNMINEGVDSVMVEHIAFPAVDDTKRNGKYIPATMSKKIVTGLLREKMGFKGVIITDGITMASLTSFCDYEDMLIGLINAGNDILLGVNPYDYEIIEKAVLDGRIPMSRIDESAERVLALKEKIGLFDDNRQEYKMSEESKKTVEIDRKIAEKSITLLYDNLNILPLKKENIKNITIVCTSNFSGTIQEIEVMKKEFEARGAKVNIIDHISTKEEVQKLAEENDFILYAAYVGPHRPLGMPSLHGTAMGTYFNAFSFGKEKSIGISMGYPYLCHDAMTGAGTFLNIYSTSPETQKAFVKVLYGEIEPTTNSPVDLEMKLRYVYC